MPSSNFPLQAGRMTGCCWLEKMTVLRMSTEQHMRDCDCVYFPPNTLWCVFIVQYIQLKTVHIVNILFHSWQIFLHHRSHAVIYKKSDTQVLQTMGKRKNMKRMMVLSPHQFLQQYFNTALTHLTLLQTLTVSITKKSSLNRLTSSFYTLALIVLCNGLNVQHYFKRPLNTYIHNLSFRHPVTHQKHSW